MRKCTCLSWQWQLAFGFGQGVVLSSVLAICHIQFHSNGLVTHLLKKNWSRKIPAVKETYRLEMIPPWFLLRWCVFELLASPFHMKRVRKRSSAIKRGPHLLSHAQQFTSSQPICFWSTRFEMYIPTPPSVTCLEYIGYPKLNLHHCHPHPF